MEITSTTSNTFTLNYSFTPVITTSSVGWTLYERNYLGRPVSKPKPKSAFDAACESGKDENDAADAYLEGLREKEAVKDQP